jgi:hypothetical protein
VRNAVRLLLLTLLFLAGAQELCASIPKTRVGNFFPLAAEPRQEVALQVPELRLDNSALYGGIVSGDTFWTKFDPDGLAPDYEIIARIEEAVAKNGFKIGGRTVTNLERFEGKEVTVDLLRSGSNKIDEALLKRVEEEFPGLKIPVSSSGRVAFEEVQGLVIEEFEGRAPIRPQKVQMAPKNLYLAS